MLFYEEITDLGELTITHNEGMTFLLAVSDQSILKPEIDLEKSSIQFANAGEYLLILFY